MSITILAIESSCDETSAAIIRDGEILSNFIANQTIHEQYGGVVPELASRAHMQNIVPVVHAALQKAGLQAGENADDTAAFLQSVNAIAFTQAPGLIGSLLVVWSLANNAACDGLTRLPSGNSLMREL